MPDAEHGRARQSWCPSGDPNQPESVLLGVQSHEHGQVAYLADPIPAGQALGMVPEGVEPRRILRFASHCTSDCANRDGADCSLITRILTIPTPEGQGTAVPRCHLRTDCKWWDQVGVEACHRCPAVTTFQPADRRFAGLVADPATTPQELEAWIAEDPGAGLSIGS